MEQSKAVKRVLDENFKLFLKDGPRIRTGYGQVILARCPDKKMVLVGGLGAMGVGEMWLPDDEYHSKLVGYEEAPIVDYDQSNDPDYLEEWHG